MPTAPSETEPHSAAVPTRAPVPAHEPSSAPQPNSANQPNVAVSLVGPPSPREIPFFLESPTPPPFSQKLSSFRSTIPTDIRIPRQPQLPDISVPSTPVSFDIFHRLVPRLFILPSDTLARLRVDLPAELDELLCEYISIGNSHFNRMLLNHALYGFTLQTAPHGMRLLLEAKEDMREDEDQEKDFENITIGWQRRAAAFQRSFLSINLHALGHLLSSPFVWAFTIVLEPSPYFGYGGLEARLSVLSPTFHLTSFHLLGISRPETDISDLAYLLNTLCPIAHAKLLGVTTELSDADHNGILGAMASRVIAHFLRLAPKSPAFFTPDHAKRGDKPPLLPSQVAKLSPGDMRKVVEKYRNRLEASWTEDMIAQIMRDHSDLSEALENRMGDEAMGLTMFEQAWEFAEGRFQALRRFVGGLATAFLYKPTERTRVSITTLEGDGLSEDGVAVAAEIILQARQFVDLRALL